MTNPFDYSRTDWYGTDGPVTSSSGSPRPNIAPVDKLVIHYAGAGTSWISTPGAQNMRNLQSYAANAGKPWEYNICVDHNGYTYEYAGNYKAAHNGSGDANGQYGNSDSFGVFCMYGLETLTTAQAEGFVFGIREARSQAVDRGWLTQDHTIKRHSDVRPGGTACPGTIGQEPYWSQITAPLTPPAPQPPEEEDMTQLVKFAQGPELFVLAGGSYAHITAESRDHYTAQGVPRFNVDNPAAYKSACVQAGVR